MHADCFGAREAVVDGDLRLTYDQFFDRCDRWSARLQRLGVKPGDRVAYIAPNIHAQLESFYAVPQIGAVLVPINYRLAADHFAYILTHLKCGESPHAFVVLPQRRLAGSHHDC